MADQQENYKVVVLGGGGVGKSAITLQMVNGYFVPMWDPTIEDRYIREIQVDGAVCQMEILDTAGQDEFKSIRDIYYRCGDGFILVYSITDAATLDDVEECIEGIVSTTVSDSGGSI